MKDKIKKLQTFKSLGLPFRNSFKMLRHRLPVCRRSWLIIAFLGLAFLILHFVLMGSGLRVKVIPLNPSRNTFIREQSPRTAIQEPVNIGLPVRLRIPSIKVDTAIEHVGITPEGAMDVPTQLADVAWYKLGPRPGQKGSAVIDGHRSSRAWIPAVFDDLQKLQVGYLIYIKDEFGMEITFIVKDRRLYDPQEDTSAIFGRNDGTYLNFITCDGDWDQVQKSFSKRLVIFTEEIRSN